MIGNSASFNLQVIDGRRHLNRKAVEGERSRGELTTALDEVARSEHQLRTIIDAIPTMAWRGRPDGTIEFLNQRWCDYIGLSSEEAGGWKWKVAVHPEDLNRLLEYWLSILASGKPGEIEARLRRFDGEYRWFLFRGEPLRDEYGNILKWYGTNIDIEDRKRAEERLRQERRELRHIVEAIPQLVHVMAPDGKLVYANQLFLEYTGLSIEEGRTDQFGLSIVHPDDFDRARRDLEAGLAHGRPFQSEHRIKRRDGYYGRFVARYNPFHDDEGQIIRWYATATDIEYRKRAHEGIRKETPALREEIDRSSMFQEIVGSSQALRRVLEQVSKAAPTDATVLILGETGTGKELIASAIHKASNRSTRAFVRVNCAAIPPSLIASELFGHERGAFTGANQRRLGRFESADGGTIFLDEIGELPAETQIALLRVLQEREFERVGSGRPIRVDVRVLAATNCDLNAAVAAGTFRQDLFYRLNVIPIQIPSLRERVDDIPLLVEFLIERFTKKVGKKIRKISTRTLEMLQAYDWPGNIRELQNVVERALVLCDGETFSIDESLAAARNAADNQDPSCFRGDVACESGKGNDCSRP